MIYSDATGEHYASIDDCIYDFLQLLNPEDHHLVMEVLAYLHHNFPAIDTNKLNLTIDWHRVFDAGHNYYEWDINYDDSEFRHHYPEYFI